ncbi:MAG TPA: UDP-N-acetylglucosamine 2-epimerase [Terracidiphilus sp.]|jgi:UDP-N-acetylglucosamine 2-epimerase (non-hydrolysing)|nr:UDP-N-acetylglucosamine 2-epimerase [Terracidiphilus sp.]
MKVATIVGTRPEIIRLSRVIALLDRYTEHTLIHTGQNYDYELNRIFFDDLEIRNPDFYLDAAGGTAADTIGLPGGDFGKAAEDTGVSYGSREPMF